MILKSYMISCNHDILSFFNFDFIDILNFIKIVHEFVQEKFPTLVGTSVCTLFVSNVQLFVVNVKLCIPKLESSDYN